MAATWHKPAGVLSIFLYRTGRRPERSINTIPGVKTDVTFSVGFAHAPATATGDGYVKTIRISREIVGEKKDWDVALLIGKPHGYALRVFEEVWEEKKYDMDYFQTSLSKYITNLIDIHALKANTPSIRLVDKHSFAKEINDVLVAIRNQYSSLMIIARTSGVEIGHINAILMMERYQPVGYKPPHMRFVAIVDPNSYLKGALHLPMATLADDVIKAFDKTISPSVLPLLSGSKGHLPEELACNNLMFVLKTEKYLTNLRKSQDIPVVVSTHIEEDDEEDEDVPVSRTKDKHKKRHRAH